jgi:hypothetical protein
MRLYYHPLSSNSRRALLTACHLGINLELVVVDLSRGEHKTPEYLRLNPNGRISVLFDGGLNLWESHAIMQYLADKSPEQDIYPQHVSARADVNRWLFWSANHFAPAAALITRERVSKRICRRLGRTRSTRDCARRGVAPGSGARSRSPPCGETMDCAGQAHPGRFRYRLAPDAYVGSAVASHKIRKSPGLVRARSIACCVDKIERLNTASRYRVPKTPDGFERAAAGGWSSNRP